MQYGSLSKCIVDLIYIRCNNCLMICVYLVCILIQGYIEIIFDCKFCFYNRDILVIGSFDGIIKLWDIIFMIVVRRYIFNDFE